MSPEVKGQSKVTRQWVCATSKLTSQAFENSHPPVPSIHSVWIAKN